MYDNEAYLVNRVYDFVGFLSLYPEIEGDRSELQLQNDPPTSIVPRLHVVKVFKDVISSPRSEEVLSEASSVRKELKRILTPLLFGDELAAEYLLLYLISSVYVFSLFYTCKNSISYYTVLVLEIFYYSEW